jgi:septum formation protein
MVEHPLVREHVERIDGTEDSVMGLSKDLVLQLLQEMRVKLKEANLQ